MWVGEWLLLQLIIYISVSNFSGISWREIVTFWWDDGDDVCFVLDQHSQLNFYNASSLKQFVGRHVAPLRHIILILSQPVFAVSWSSQRQT